MEEADLRRRKIAEKAARAAVKKAIKDAGGYVPGIGEIYLTAFFEAYEASAEHE